MDEGDMGNTIADRHLKHALADQKARVHSSRESRMDCMDCGITIPEARRKAVQGCQRCVGCQIAFEEEAYAV